MNNIIFPEGISWRCEYVTGGDFLSSDVKIDGQELYRYAKNNIIDVKADVSGTTQPSYMFGNCLAKYIKNLNMPNVTRCDYMFNQASKLIVAPSFDTSRVTKVSYMFQSCTNLMYIPPLDLSRARSVSAVFRTCRNLVNVPTTNFSSVTSSLEYLFSECENLVEIPDMNISSATNFGSSYNSWLSNAYAVMSIGILECDSITSISYVFGGSVNYRIKHLGGFRNLGKKSSVSGTNGSYFLDYAPNLTYESVVNVLNLLYDRASAGLSVLTLKLHPNHLAMLSEDDIAVATNKGWTLV